MKREEFNQVATAARSQFDMLPTESRGSFNQFLMQMYEAQTGQTVFKTFNAWKSEGYGVIKGESSFPIYSRPTNVIKAEKAAAKGQEFHAEGKSFFGICHLFHAGQVQPIEKK